MTFIAFLGGVILGAVVMAVYSLTHGSKVDKLGTDIMNEFAKLKAKV